MKSYTKIYLKHFNFCVEDFIPCEICGKRASDIHHIIARSRDKSLLNDINNLMALCRQHHIEYGDKNQHLEYLKQTHNEYLNQ